MSKQFNGFWLYVILQAIRHKSLLQRHVELDNIASTYKSGKEAPRETVLTACEQSKTKMLKNILLYMVCLSGPITAAVAAESISFSHEEQQYQSSSLEAKTIGEPYFNAYIERDWRKFESKLHTQAAWSDPTAEKLFGTERVVGKEKVISHLRSSFAGIHHMQAHVRRKVFSSNIAVFEADLDWSIRLSNGKSVDVKSAPFVVVLRIKDGKVIEHTDYADYSGFISEFQKVRSR